MDTKIFIYGHKNIDYGYWDNELYCPLEVGSALHDKEVLKVRDNEGDNISDWNGVYGEVTGMYWLWKNVVENPKGLKGAEAEGLRGQGAEGTKSRGAKGLKFIGQCQYRRRLEFAEDEDFAEIFKSHDIIVAKPLRLGWSLKQQYKNCHNGEDIEFAEQIVKEMYPEYADDWDRYINYEGVIYYSSGMVMKKKDFSNYCRWVFSIFEEYKKRKGWKSVDDVRNYVEKNIISGKHNSARGLNYQMQIFGFLQERLFSLYVRHNFKKIFEIEYKKYENV